MRYLQDISFETRESVFEGVQTGYCTCLQVFYIAPYFISVHYCGNLYTVNTVYPDGQMQPTTQPATALLFYL